MPRGTKRRLLIALSVVLASAPALALLITDGDFSTWTFSSFGTGTATVTREPAGGNPGARLNVTTSTGGSLTAFGTALKTDSQVSSALEGLAFTLSLDVLSAPGTFGQGQAIHLLVEQGGTIYTQSLGVTNVQASFATVQFVGVLTAGSFARQIGAGPTTPIFDGSVVTRFGFAAGNSISGVLTQYYDNFSLDIAGLTPTPTPTTVASATPTPTRTATTTPTNTPPSTGPATPGPAVPTLDPSGLLVFGILIAGAGLALLIRRG